MNPKIYKAILLLQRHKEEKAISILEEVRSISKTQNDLYSWGQASSILGELYFQKEQFDQSAEYLNEVIGLKLEDDVLEDEVNHSISLLKAIHSR